MNLQELIDINKQYRRHYISDIEGLIELDNIAIEHTPTIISGSVVLPKNHKLVHTVIEQPPINIINNTQHKYDAFISDKCPLIFEILNRVDGIVLCGGGALWAYMGYTTMPKDFDIFLYDSEQDLANNKAKRMYKINEILNIIQSHKLIFTFELVKGVITIILKDIEIQIILRDYFSISEILHSFDISSCAIAYDGKTTYFTKLAEWSLINHLNIILPEYRSSTYEIRLKKYFDRGFGLVFLCLSNMDEPIIHLPNITIDIYCTINEDKNIAIGNIKLPKLQIINSFVVNDCDIDYDTIKEKKRDILYSNDIFELNCNQVFKKSAFFLYSYKKTKSLYAPMHSNFIFIDKMMIFNILGESWRTSYAKWLEKLLMGIIIKQGNMYILNNSQLKYFIKNTIAPTDNAEEVYLSIKTKLDNDIEQVNYRLSAIDTKLCSAQVKLYKNELKRLFDGALQYYKQIKNNYIDWCIYLNRDIELNGSLHITSQTNKEWYGDKYCGALPTVDCGALPTVTYNTNELLKTMHYHIRNSLCNTICPLCLEDINIILSANIITLKCGHIYHKDKDLYCRDADTWNCQGILKWFKQSKVCPECRDSDTPISVTL